MQYANRKIISILISLAFFSLNALAQNEKPVWSFTPLTPTTISVLGNGTAAIKYTVTNNSSKSHTLAMTPITGITQRTGGIGTCLNPFVLPTQGSSCTLFLQVNGSKLTHSISDGPVVCEQGSTLECYRPSENNVLNIRVAADQYTVGGTISGMTGTITLLNNGENALTTSNDGSFTFTNTLTNGSTYAVTIGTEPNDENCTVNNASGTINSANVTNVIVTCSENEYTVGGTVAGLTGTVVLQNNGTDSRTLIGNGSFAFPAQAQGSTYAVTVQTQPNGQTCSVSNGTGTVGASNVTNVRVTCHANAYTVGGTVSGLSGTVTLLNNGGNSTPISTNGSFTFSQPVAQGSRYAVTVGTQPTAQICTVTNGSDIMGTANVTNVIVDCSTSTTTISVPSTGEIPVYYPDGTGLANTLTVTNIGTVPALNVSASLPGGWTAGVIQDATACTNIQPNNSCTLTFKSKLPYIAQGGITVTGTNVLSPPTTALAFTVDGYLVWDVYVSSTNFPQVEVIKDTDSAATGQQPWAPGPPFTLINGISDTSTTPCIGATEGRCNTEQIYSVYDGLGVDPSTYAAGLCYRIVNDNSGPVDPGTWYLPAICQMGVEGTGLGANCDLNLPNINTNLVQLGFGNLAGTGLGFSGIYWSSTTWSTNPQNVAWAEDFLNPAYGTSIQDPSGKDVEFGVRCARAITL